MSFAIGNVFAIVLFLVAILSVLTNVVTAIPDGFEDSLLPLSIPNRGGITDIVFTPDGMLLVALKWGQVYAYDDFENNPSRRTLILDLSDQICTGAERALGSIGVHHDFIRNRHIYAYWTWPKHGKCNVEDFETGPVNKLSRFTLMDNNVADMASEMFILQSPVCPKNWHNGGKILFGKDNLMYVSIGDGFQHGVLTSQDMANLWGTIVRVTDTGEIPEDNPYANGPRCNEMGLTTQEGVACAEIYESGLRNPWKFAMDPNTENNKVRFFISDVGGSVWEELNEGGHDFAGANFGWPVRDGPCKFNGYSDTSEYFNNKEFPYDDCERKDREYVDPIHFYTHNTEFEGACTSGAFVPNGLWPVEYDNSFIYTDFIFHQVYIIREADEECRSCIPPKSSYNVEPLVEFEGREGVVAMTFGPYNNNEGQALYYAARNPHGIRRFVYKGNANRRPNAAITASTESGLGEVTIIFDGTSSTDPDGDALSFEWDFDGDGMVDSVEPKPSFTFRGDGIKEVYLTVLDGRGGQDTVSKQISVGVKPVPIITDPIEGSTFAVGDLFVLRGYALDKDGETLPELSLHWEVQQHHLNHFHPFLGANTKGNNIELLPAPEPEDASAATTSFLRVLLTATDNNGLFATAVRDIMPRIVVIEFDSIPSNRDLVVNGKRVVTPTSLSVWENQKFNIEAPTQYSLTSKFSFSSWSDNGSKTHSITVLPSDTRSFVANFVEEDKTDPPVLLTSQSVILTDDTVVSNPPGLFLHQQPDGNLVLHSGSPNNSQGILWSTGYSGPSGDYFTVFQEDGNLICWGGTPSNRGAVLWKSDSVVGVGRHYLQYVPYENLIIISEGKPEIVNDPDSTRAWFMGTWELSEPEITSSPTLSSAPSASPIISPSESPTKSPVKDVPSKLPTNAPILTPVDEMPSSTPSEIDLTNAPSDISLSVIDPPADPLCQLGLLRNNACCPASCEECGGIGCYADVHRSGSELCCSEHILESSRDCSVVGAPCIVIPEQVDDDYVVAGGEDDDVESNASAYGTSQSVLSVVAAATLGMIIV